MAMMLRRFTDSHTRLDRPPKEGRTYIGGPHATGIGSKHRHRLLVVAIFMVFMIVWIRSFNLRDPSTTDVVSGYEAVLKTLTGFENKATPAFKQIGASNSQFPVNVRSTRQGQYVSLSPPADVSQQLSIQKYSPGNRQTATEPFSMNTNNRGINCLGLEKAFEHVKSLLPDETDLDRLLGDFDHTGRERIREVGLRARAYKLFFEAWENLHVVSVGEDGVYVHNNVVQHLRKCEDQEKSLTNWHHPLAETIRLYEEYRSFLERLGRLLFPWTLPYFSDHMTLHAHIQQGGRGLVLTAGNAQAPHVLTMIPVLRHLGCSLPIEVMYFGDQDLTEDYRTLLERFDGVVTRDFSPMIDDQDRDSGRWAHGSDPLGWASKTFAILFSSFREVVFIDADAYFMQNPELLFEDVSYKETGTLFFYDRLIYPQSRKRLLQQILPKPISEKAKQSRFWTGLSKHMQESGVVVVDKWRHFIALLLVTRMNGPDRHGNEAEGGIGVYEILYGDKETFWIAWELVGDLDYAFHPGATGVMGIVQEQEEVEEKEDDQQDKKHQRDAAEVQGKTSDKETSVHAPKDAVSREPYQASPEESPATYMICSPQLLHLDNAGRPLWFNGGLLRNKIAQGRQRKLSRFEAYIREPSDNRRDANPWELRDYNVGCLTTAEPLEFTDQEQRTLKVILHVAEEVGIHTSEAHGSE